MSKPALARYRATNWSQSGAALRRRGSLLVWLDGEVERRAVIRRTSASARLPRSKQTV